MSNNKRPAIVVHMHIQIRRLQMLGRGLRRRDILGYAKPSMERVLNNPAETQTKSRSPVVRATVYVRLFSVISTIDASSAVAKQMQESAAP